MTKNVPIGKNMSGWLIRQLVFPDRDFLSPQGKPDRSILPEWTFAARRTAAGRTSAPRRRSFQLDWSLVAAGPRRSFDTRMTI